MMWAFSIFLIQILSVIVVVCSFLEFRNWGNYFKKGKQTKKSKLGASFGSAGRLLLGSLLLQLPAYGTLGSRSGSRTRVSSNNTGDPGLNPGSWLWPGANSGICGIWGIKQWIEPSSYLSHSVGSLIIWNVMVQWVKLPFGASMALMECWESSPDLSLLPVQLHVNMHLGSFQTIAHYWVPSMYMGDLN